MSFGDFAIVRGAEPFLDHEAAAFGQNAAHVLAIELIVTVAAHARRYVLEERVDKHRKAGAYIGFHQIGANESHAAVDVVADAAGTDDAALGRVSRRNATDAETVTPVNVRHGQRSSDDSGQRGDISDLV